MPLSFDFKEIQPKIETGTLVLTPNARTQQAILNGQMATYSRGEIYQPVNVLSLTQWVDQLWDELTFLQPVPRIISSLAVKTWYENTIESEPNWTLTNPAGVANKALESLKNLVDWNLISSGVASVNHVLKRESSSFVDFQSKGLDYESIETEYFIKWGIQFREFCQNNNLIPDFCRLAYLAELKDSSTIDFPSKILLTSFDHKTPLLTSYLLQLQRLQVEIVEFSFSPNKKSEKSTGSKVEFSCFNEEIEFAARYAKAFVERTALSSDLASHDSQEPVLGIVVENLQENLAIVHQYFSETFHPLESKPWVSLTKPDYNVSAGSPLSEQPIVVAAIKILGLGSYQLSREDIHFLKTSPFFEWHITKLADSNATKTIKNFLNSIYLKQQKYFTVANLINDILQDENLAQLTPLLHRLEFLQDKKNHSIQINEHLNNWQRQLAFFGWHGSAQVQRTFEVDLCEGLNEFELKACSQFHDALIEVDELSILHTKSREQKAFNFLTKILSNKTFQIASDYSNVQVLGMLEATGLKFTELLIIGFNANNWPQKKKSNPFIPLQYQREKNMPASSPEREYEYAEILSKSLLDASSRIIVSCSGELGAAGNEASFFSHLPSKTTEHFFNDDGKVRNEIKDPQIAMSAYYEWIEDSYRAQPSDKLFGGAYLISDYAKCPFYSLLKHQFKLAVFSDIEPGIDPMEKGTWLHEAMEKIWRRLKNYDGLINLSKDELESLVVSTLTLTLESRKEKLVSHSNKEIIAIEKEKLFSQIMQWMAIELDREPFDKVLLEKKYQLDLDSFTLNFRIDRINLTNHGARQSIEIIDYKTGKVKMSNWLGVRPTEAQMPAYVLALSTAFSNIKKEKNHTRVSEEVTQSLSMLGYAVIKTEGISMQGLEFSDEKSRQRIARFTHSAESKKYLKESQLKAVDLSVLSRDWHVSLSRIAKAIRKGWMPVAPKDESVCRYCDFKSICRINESQPAELSVKGSI